MLLGCLTIPMGMSCTPTSVLGSGAAAFVSNKPSDYDGCGYSGGGDHGAPMRGQAAPAQGQSEGSVPEADSVVARQQAGSGIAADAVVPWDQAPLPWDQAGGATQATSQDAPAWDQAAPAWDQAATTDVDAKAAPAWDQAAPAWDQVGGIHVAPVAAPAWDQTGGDGKAERVEASQKLPGPPPRPPPPSKPAAVPVRINVQGSYERAIDENDYQVPRGGYFFEVLSMLLCRHMSFLIFHKAYMS